jgi:hypothetical protein
MLLSGGSTQLKPMRKACCGAFIRLCPCIATITWLYYLAAGVPGLTSHQAGFYTCQICCAALCCAGYQLLYEYLVVVRAAVPCLPAGSGSC